MSQDVLSLWSEKLTAFSVFQIVVLPLMQAQKA